MKVDIKVPTVGESISEGVLSAWLVADGAHVTIDQPIFELETDKVTMEVPAPATGTLTHGVGDGEDVKIGQTVGAIDTAAATARAAESEAAAAPAPPPSVETAPLSPAVRRMVAEYDLQPGSIAATGRDGRLTKGDIIDHLEAAKTPSPAAAPAPKGAPAAAPVPAPKMAPATFEGVRETREKMSSLRRRLAERLVTAQQTAAILTTFNEADMSAVLALRAAHKAGFEKRHGVRLGFMSFFVKAAVDALKSVPAVNARIEGDEIVHNHFFDIGVAVSTEHGLVVPVVRNADRLGFAEIEQTIADLADRAQRKRLTLDELQGASFSLSNGGVFGSLLSTPILNPPQAGILGMHSIKKRPMVVNDELVIRPMMYLALSYDHRLVDGREAVTFLKRIVDCIEQPSRMMLEV